MRTLRLSLVIAAALVAAALFAPTAQAQCTVIHSVTYIDTWVDANGSTVVETTIYMTISCSGYGGSSDLHYGVYQAHSGGGSNWWFYNVDGVEIGRGGNPRGDFQPDDETLIQPPNN